MRIDLEQSQIDFVRETLADVDTRAYDPIYKTTIDRVVLSSVKEGSGFVNKVVIEESEVFTIIEALQERSEHAQTPEDVKSACTDMLTYIEESTGLTL
jgi:hypothetical protein